MSKKFTFSLLVLAATLLALPINAQLVVKKQAKTKYAALKSGPVKPADLKKAKAARMKAESAIDGQTFTGQDFVNMMKACVDNAQEEKVALQKEMERKLSESLNGHKGQLVLGKKYFNLSFTTSHSAELVLGKAPLKAPRLGETGEVVDDNGVIIAIPEGDTKIYQRAGLGWGRDNSGLYYDDQVGTIEITELADGTVYFKDFFSQVSADTYIKGTKEGNTITIPSGQVVYFFTSSGYGMRTGFAEYDSENGFIETKAGDPYVLTVDGNTISLTETSFDFETATGTIAALLYTDDDTFCGFGDNNTVFTYDPEYVAPELVELPEGAVVDTWYNNATSYSSSAQTPYESSAKVAFVGDDVYLSGIFKNYPDSWIKGTIDGTTVTFSGLQYVGDYSGYNIFAVGTDGTALEDFQMTYDAASKTLTSVNDLLANAKEDQIYYLEWYKNISITKDAPAEPTATTGANVDVLPYSNALSTADEFADFGVIDSNKDGKTWSFSASNGANYSYSSTNAANDWLISPAIKLEAGKKYHFAIDAKNNGYTEKFEVLLGAEAKASDLTQSVIEEQVVNNAEFVTFENEAVEVAETGYYHFGIHAISDADQFRLMVANFLVEAGVETDAPAAVTDFALAQTEGKLEVTVSFKAPTKTSGGDDLTDNLTKIEILRDGAVIKTLENVAPGAEVNYVDNDEALKVGTYTYQVIPYNAAGIGVKSEEKSIFLSVVLDVPYTFDFSQNLLDLFGVIDNNADGKTWSWSASNGAYYPYSGTNDADDYLITLPFNLEASKTYNVIVAAKNTGYVEKFEVKAGKTATVEGLTETIIPETVAESQEAFIDYEGMFKPAEDGQYYIAIHAISPADQFNLLISSLTIELAPEATAPAAIADLAVAAGAEGALEANLSFTAPAKAINGEALTGNVDVKIYRDGELINTLTDIPAGSEKTWKDATVEGGSHTYYLIAANDSGDGLKSEKVSVFVGEDQVGAVENIQVTATTANTISLSWDEVAGVNGGYVNTADVKYAVVSMHVETVWLWDVLVVDDVLGTVKGATSGTFDYAVDEGEQDYAYFGVVALQGDAEAPAAGDEFDGGYTSTIVGAPYTMPFAESFTGGTLTYGIWTYSGAEDAYVTLTDDASDNDGGAVLMTTYDAAGEVKFESGKIKIEGANPTLLFDAKGLGDVTAAKVYASVDDADWTLISTQAVTAEYATVKVPMTNAKGERFTRLAFAVDVVTPSEYQGQNQSTGEYIFDWHDCLLIDNIRIMDLYEYNLVADIQAPKSVVAGQTAKVVATVANEGEFAANGYTVEVKANGKVLTTVVASEALASFAKDVIEVPFETSVFDEAGDVTLTVNVDFENELVPDDNTASTIITVKEPTAISPASLLAEDKGVRGVDLTWAMTAEEVEEAGARAAAENSEDFEDQEVFEPFSLGGITADEHYGAFGDWTLYDGNGITVYGFNSWSFDNMGEPQAWQVFNPALVDAQVAANYPAHSGEQFMWSFCPVDNSGAPAADHWLISPELTGDAQTISFFARTITDQYGAETFEVLASSTDNQAASFAKVADYSTTATDWEEFTAELPAGSKFFAIRHTSTDVFGLLVDDVTFTAAGASAPVPTAFNIYYNGEKIGTAEAEKTSYNVPFEKIAAGEQVFGVSAVYANGSESRAVTDTITIVPVEPVIAEGKYYLYNVAAEGYVVGANNWGTRASITKIGGLEIEAVLANGKYELTTASVYPGKHLGFNGYVDNGDLSNWIIDPVEGKDGVFTLSSDGTNVLFWDGGEATTTSVGAMPEVAENAYWKFVSAEDRLAMLNEATAENPVDATFLLVNPNFSRASNTATWQGDSYSIGGANEDSNAEKWGGNSEIFDVHQTISVPDGIYKLTWNGYYRYNNTSENTNAVAVEAHAAGTEVINSFVYANDKDFALTSIADDAAVAALTALGKEIPFSQSDASFAFSNGIYEQSAEIIVKDGQLTIGVKKIEHPGCDWTVWDNFRLTYLGVEVKDDDPELEAPEGWTKAIANGNLAGDNVASFVSKEYPSSDIVPARIVAGAGKNNSRGIVVKAGDDTGNDKAVAWDSQFWIQLNEKLTEGTKVHIEFDYKASKAAKGSTQAHSNPGNYLHWAMMGDVNFTTEWQHFSADVTVDAAMAKGDNGNGSGDGLFSIAFNLQEEKSAVDYFFDNFGVWYQMPVVDGINAMKNEKNAKSVYNLNGQKVNVTKKGLYIQNGKKVVIK